MSGAKDELANLDEDWEERPVAAQAQPANVSSLPPDLGDLDDGWNTDSSPSAAASLAKSAHAARREGAAPESPIAPAVAWLSKRQRRELAKQQRRHATQRRAERKQARKQERRDQAHRSAAERSSSVVVRGAATDTRAVGVTTKGKQALRKLEAPATERARSGLEGRRSLPSTSGLARSERTTRAERSGPQETEREAMRRRAVRAPAAAGQQRKMSWALYLLIAAVVAALGAWATLR
jgi:hypothetical protein